MDDVSRKLRDGCPSYYNESDYQFYQAVESLERAAATSDAEERERLAKEALELLSRVPETADLLSVCQRFEDIRWASSQSAVFFQWMSMSVGFERSSCTRQRQRTRSRTSRAPWVAVEVGSDGRPWRPVDC